MPFPLVAHQGIGAPFLLADRWRKLDPVAFLVGTLAPDLPYALDRSRFDFDAWGHRPLGLVLWAIPISVVAAWAFRSLVARPLAAHVPDLGNFRLRDLGGLADTRPGVVAAALSGLFGAITHVVADGFTHPEPWVSDRLPFLHDESPVGLPSYIGRPTYWYDVFYWVADIGGVMLAVGLLYWAGQRRAQQRLPRPALPRPTGASQRALWGCVAVGAAIGLALAWRVLWIETVAQASMLFTCSVALALLVGCRRAEPLMAPALPATSSRPAPAPASASSRARAALGPPGPAGACPCCGRS